MEAEGFLKKGRVGRLLEPHELLEWGVEPGQVLRGQLGWRVVVVPPQEEEDRYFKRGDLAIEGFREDVVLHISTCSPTIASSFGAPPLASRLRSSLSPVRDASRVRNSRRCSRTSALLPA